MKKFADTKSGNTYSAARLLSIKELQKVFGVTEWFWRERIWNGDLPYIRAGNKQLVDVNDVNAYIEKNKTRNLA